MFDNEAKNKNIEIIKELYYEFKLARVIIIGSGALLSIFLLGKIAAIISISISDFKKLKRAINE